MKLDKETQDEVDKIRNFVKRYHVFLSSKLDDEDLKVMMKVCGVMPLDKVRIIKQRQYERNKAIEDAEFRAAMKDGCRKFSVVMLVFIVGVALIALAIGLISRFVPQQ